MCIYAMSEGLHVRMYVVCMYAMPVCMCMVCCLNSAIVTLQAKLMFVWATRHAILHAIAYYTTVYLCYASMRCAMLH